MHCPETISPNILNENVNKSVTNALIVPETPWRLNLGVKRYPLFLQTKETCLPSYDQELVIDFHLMKRFSTSTPKYSPNYNGRQSSIMDFVTGKKNDHEKYQTTALFDDDQFSPIKLHPEKDKNRHNLNLEILDDVHLNLSKGDINYLVSFGEEKVSDENTKQVSNKNEILSKDKFAHCKRKILPRSSSLTQKNALPKEDKNVLVLSPDIDKESLKENEKQVSNENKLISKNRLLRGKRKVLSPLSPNICVPQQQNSDNRIVAFMDKENVDAQDVYLKKQKIKKIPGENKKKLIRHKTVKTPQLSSSDDSFCQTQSKFVPSLPSKEHERDEIMILLHDSKVIENQFDDNATNMIETIKNIKVTDTNNTHKITARMRNNKSFNGDSFRHVPVTEPNLQTIHINSDLENFFGFDDCEYNSSGNQSDNCVTNTAEMQRSDKVSDTNVIAVKARSHNSLNGDDYKNLPEIVPNSQTTNSDVEGFVGFHDCQSDLPYDNAENNSEIYQKNVSDSGQTSSFASKDNCHTNLPYNNTQQNIEIVEQNIENENNTDHLREENGTFVEDCDGNSIAEESSDNNFLGFDNPNEKDLSDCATENDTEKMLSGANKEVKTVQVNVNVDESNSNINEFKLFEDLKPDPSIKVSCTFPSRIILFAYFCYLSTKIRKCD